MKMQKAERSKIKNIESNCTSFVTRLIYDKQKYTEIQVALTVAIILTHLPSTLLTRADRLLFLPPPPTKVTEGVFTIEKLATYH